MACRNIKGIVVSGPATAATAATVATATNGKVVAANDAAGTGWISPMAKTMPHLMKTSHSRIELKWNLYQLQAQSFRKRQQPKQPHQQSF